MVEIECLVCGKAIEIPKFIDTNNYDGQVTCPECASLLHVKLVGAKVRKYMVVERKPRSLTVAESGLSRKTGGEEADVESIAKYNPLRDFLATYRATQLQLAFEQIESIIGSKLETAAYTFKSWWENDRRNPQAIAWLESGWEVVDVILQQRKVILRRVE
jgi:DNA-directed RNA polymerase subunit RPC12/RpoP